MARFTFKPDGGMVLVPSAHWSSDFANFARGQKVAREAPVPAPIYSTVSLTKDHLPHESEEERKSLNDLHFSISPRSGKFRFLARWSADGDVDSYYHCDPYAGKRVDRDQVVRRALRTDVRLGRGVDD